MSTALKLRRSFSSWGVPLTYTVATLAIGTIGPRLEHGLFPNWVSTISAGSAVAICSAVGSGMIALTGIVFSLVFVMVQFSATAYSPRLVLWVSRDPVMSHALGIFTSTFLYSLLLMAWIDRESSGAVPLFASWFVVVLLLASMGVFIALIHRIGMLQVNRMLVFTGNYGRAAIAELYGSPELSRKADREPMIALASSDVTQSVLHVGRPQIIQRIKIHDLLLCAQQSGGVIEVKSAVGDTVMEGSAMVCIHHSRQPIDEAGLKAAFVIGDERTFEQDPKYALRLLVDIAIKALSPAINDPTTAVQALDQIEDLLIRLGRSRLDIGRYRDGQGAVRVVISFPSWDDFMRLALDEIRFCGAQSVQVMRRMNAVTKNLLGALPEERHEALHYWEKRLRGTVVRAFEDADERHDASVVDRQGLGIGEETATSIGR